VVVSTEAVAAAVAAAAGKHRRDAAMACAVSKVTGSRENLKLRSVAGVFFLASLVIPFAVGASEVPQSAAQSPQPAQPFAQPASKAKTPARRLPTAPPIHSKPQTNQKTFASPQEAASALSTAASNNDENALLLILGADAVDIVQWTDKPEDRKTEREQFAQKYGQMHRLVKEPDGETTLYVGAENWPLPIPLVQANGAWFFETSLGRQEILYRRVGENELNTIDVLHAIVDAQKEYHSKSADSVGAHAYAAHFNSGKGAHDGLYWPSANNDSPLGPYLARASYNRSDRQPLHGYFFRILTEQGANARGGSRSYIVNGKMTGGFAVVAFPAQYRVSGVKTFLINQDSTVYECDFGPMTTELSTALKAYNPDSTWRKAP
jgi:hypothetical protein